jgi:hypothetical protein
MDGVNAAGASRAVMDAAARVEHTFVEAARARKLVRLFEEKDRVRLVEPHMVFRSGGGKTLLHMYQVGGYSSQPDPRGWRNAEPRRFVSAEVADEAFQPRPDYNPFNAEHFPHVVFAIPTAGGRRRKPNPE